MHFDRNCILPLELLGIQTIYIVTVFSFTFLNCYVTGKSKAEFVTSKRFYTENNKYFPINQPCGLENIQCLLIVNILLYCLLYCFTTVYYTAYIYV